MTAELNQPHGTVTDGGGTYTAINPANVNDGNDVTYGGFNSAVESYGQRSALKTDLGADYTVTTMYVLGGMGSSSGTDGLDWQVEYSVDGVTFVNASAVNAISSNPGQTTLTLPVSRTARYWRLYWYFTSALGFVSPIWIYRWDINGDPATVPDPPTEGPPYEAPAPGGALVEIYAAEPGAYRWGLARWGESIWSAAGWRDVTPESVDVEILWGSQRPELGILSKPEAASWAIDFYDPGRTLDPANASGPYYGDLEPGLPVRISHNGLVIKQGLAEEIGYVHSREFGAEGFAYLRVTDVISVLANAQVPDDSVLADTLFARARDAVAAAGLAVTVLADPAAGDPALAPWEAENELSAWDWIVDAAESVLWVPYVTNVGHLGFRAWAEPFDRGRVLRSPNLVGLQSIVAHNGLYSVVQAQQTVADGDALITRELTPKPRYGARTFSRDARTPNASDWAAAVLADRAQAGLRWVPGQVYPLTAADVTYFAEIGAGEEVGLYYPEADPAVIQNVIVVGGRIGIVGKKDSEAVWSFEFQAAQARQGVLATEDLQDWLIRDDDPTEFLYPDG